MLFTLASLCLPPLLVFGVYHLLTWFDAFGINAQAFWKRVALASAVRHVLLASGFFVFSYLDFQAHVRLEPGDEVSAVPVQPLGCLAGDGELRCGPAPV